MRLARLLSGKEEGTLMIEMCAVCILLVTFFLFMGEVVLYVKDIIHVQQAAREGAREASIISSSPRFSSPVAAGQEKAEDCMNQYFGSQSARNVVLMRANGSFTCQVQYEHRVFCMPSVSRNVRSTAIYPDFGN